MSEALEYEKMNENPVLVDGHIVKAPEEYQDPEKLFRMLVERVRR